MREQAERTDAISLLIHDHKEIEQLFRKAERAGITSDELRGVARSIRQRLSMHAAAEEQILYPAIRAQLGNQIVEESLEDHLDVKRLLAELDRLEPGGEEFESALTDLIDEVRTHVEQEETKLLPRVAHDLPPEQLEEMGRAMEAVLTIAPTRPHPNAPDTPPANIAAGLVTGVTDRARDAIEKVGDLLRRM